MSRKNKPEIRDRTIFDVAFIKVVLKFVFSTWFKLTGWKTTPSAPEGAGITIAAPHTSNWDIIYALGAAIIFDIKIYFSIKDSWCRAPLVGPVILWFGGIPIDRSSKGQGQVEQIKQFVQRHKQSRIFFLFTPEGTRGKVASWKTGFYHVAQDCGLPIFLAKVDYRTKESGVFHAYQLTGDKDADIATIQESYKSVYGKFPLQQYPAYAGPMPKISEAEAMAMRALYSFKGKATLAEIAARAKFHEITAEMLDFMVAKGVLERVKVLADGKNVTTYRLTLAGNGCLLHLSPSLG
ncbi:MAG: 1-acyl-sn-glycerol-3-phosphate acyltransferase [Burkholderiaceae bacterium]|nr:1-acyl-sn-glycerol-3-phosphate acyltransferase [Burkholderiaceae bacterium]